MNNILMPVRETKRICRSITKHVCKAILGQSVPKRVISKYYSGLATFIMYHNVIKDLSSMNELTQNALSLTVSEKAFAEQMKYVSEHYNCISLGTAIDNLKTNKLADKSLVVTFDDGYKENLFIALPILERYSVPAIIYITTGFIEHQATLWWYEIEYIINQLHKVEFKFEGKQFNFNLTSKMKKIAALNELKLIFKTLNLQDQDEFIAVLRKYCDNQFSYTKYILSWDEIRELDRHPLITIGAHTHHHPVLSRLSDADILNDILISRERLEKHLKHTIEHFAYPFGGLSHVDARVAKIVKELDFSSAVTTNFGHIFEAHRDYLYNLPRIGVSHSHSMKDFIFNLSGVTSMLLNRGKRIAGDLFAK